MDLQEKFLLFLLWLFFKVFPLLWDNILSGRWLRTVLIGRLFGIIVSGELILVKWEELTLKEGFNRMWIPEIWTFFVKLSKAFYNILPQTQNK
ncbi:hypothetical protein [Thermococcus guaymasensis]|uniref:hypothetical protein n=1 Tax=Thermococcus guaymasensis TaxID=110164 RepID=UPI0012EC7E70|nr:hypothetical protein [Thermococcus guaymasensis]